MLTEDFNLKLNRIRNLLTNEEKAGLLLTSQQSFAWLTGGRGFINTATEEACCKILVTHSSAILIVNNIEKERLKSEEGCDVFDEILSYQWYEKDGERKLIQSLTSGEEIAIETELAGELFYLRSELTQNEINRYIELGRDAATALESVCEQIKSGQTEWDIAAQIALNCIRLNMEPVVNLVASDERVFRYRHPLPTSKSVDQYILMALGARRHGLVVSLSRLVHFGRISDELKRKHDAVIAVDAAFIGNTIPGNQYDDIFKKGLQEYKNQGFPDEWKNHHQGGLTGFLSREHKVTLDSKLKVTERQAYAWNPTITGVKSEDTFISGSAGQQIITRTGRFPEQIIEVNGYKIPRPLILERFI